MLVLLVGTSTKLSQEARVALLAEGFAVDRVRGGAAGLVAAAARDYDVVVLDLGLPMTAGYDLLRVLRERHIQTPVLMLDGDDGVHPVNDAFDLPVPDYLTRPTSFVALMARLWGLVRHRPDATEGKLAVGSLVLDPARRVVERSGVPVALSAREYGLLMFLMRHAGDVVSKAQILDEVWTSTSCADNVVEVYIGYLRKKLDVPFHLHTLRTVRGLGYRLDSDQSTPLVPVSAAHP